MNTRATVAFEVLAFVLTVSSYAQQLTENNATQMAAAYMLRVSYNERGYMGVRVDVKHDGGKDVFVVEPGPVYHVRDFDVTGLSGGIAQTAMSNAPKPGDVYSAARLNDWVAEAVKVLKQQNSNLKPKWGVKLDRERAEANLFVHFE